MNENFQNFSVQEAMKLAKSDAGRQLMALLQQQNSKQIQDAMAQAGSGNYVQAKATLSSILENPQARALLNQLGRENDE